MEHGPSGTEGDEESVFKIFEGQLLGWRSRVDAIMQAGADTQPSVTSQEEGAFWVDDLNKFLGRLEQVVFDDTVGTHYYGSYFSADDVYTINRIVGDLSISVPVALEKSVNDLGERHGHHRRFLVEVNSLRDQLIKCLVRLLKDAEKPG